MVYLHGHAMDRNISEKEKVQRERMKTCFFVVEKKLELNVEICLNDFD